MYLDFFYFFISRFIFHYASGDSFFLDIVDGAFGFMIFCDGVCVTLIIVCIVDVIEVSASFWTFKKNVGVDL